MIPKIFLLTSLLFGGLLLSPAPLPAQALNIPAERYGVSIGNAPSFNGLRFNFRDRGVEAVNGLNLTIWTPRDLDSTLGQVNGLALGLPISLQNAQFNGINLAFGGAGAAGTARGIQFAGLGVGAGVDLHGIIIGGLGVGAGQSVVGLSFGGLGVGAGDRVAGLNIGGLGVGAGNDVQGVTIGGLGVGAGNNLWGITIGGLGIGAGSYVTGLNIAGLAVGAGQVLRGINIAGLGVGAPKVAGLSVSPLLEAEIMEGIAITPAYYHLAPQSEMGEGPVQHKGVAVSAFSNIRGEHRGLTISILNIADDLKGVQLGLLNIARSNPKGLKVLPVFNADFR